MYSLAHISLHDFSYFFLKIIFLQKDCQTRIICYLFIRYRYDNFFEEVFILVSKVTKCALLARVWEWRRIETDCPVMGLRVFNEYDVIFFFLGTLLNANESMNTST